MGKTFLNEGWIFYPKWQDACIKTAVAAQGEKIRLPHAANLLNTCKRDMGADEKMNHRGDFQCGYVRMLPIPESFRGKVLRLTFEGILKDVQIFVNGHFVAEHAYGHTAFSVNIESYVNYGYENRIALKVGGEGIQGIFRDVYLQVKDPRHIEDIFVRTKNRRAVSDEDCGGEALLVLSFRLTRAGILSESSYVGVSVFDAEDNCLFTSSFDLEKLYPELKETLRAGQRGKPELRTNRSRTATLRINFEQVDYWHINWPRLYYAEVVLYDGFGEIVDEKTVRFGFRDVIFKQDKIWLNGQEIKGRGLVWAFPEDCTSPAMTRSMDRLCAEDLIERRGAVVIHSGGHPLSKAFVERCDELGGLVISQVSAAEPGQLSGNLREMIAQYRNHPSIVFWSLGDCPTYRESRRSWSSGELSQPKHCLELAKRMDPTRKLVDDPKLKASFSKLSRQGEPLSAAVSLKLECSRRTLMEHQGYDATFIKIRVQGLRDELLLFYNRPVRIKVTGPIALMGPEYISLMNGCGGFFVKTLGGTGRAQVTVFAESCVFERILLNVVRPGDGGLDFYERFEG